MIYFYQRHPYLTTVEGTFADTTLTASIEVPSVEFS